MSFADTLLKDKNGRIVVWQWPNAPLWVWVVATVAGWFLRGTANAVVGATGTAALAVWAVMEIGWGDSLFRRLLGVAVAIYILVSLVMKLLLKG